MLKNQISPQNIQKLAEKECRYTAGGAEVVLTPDFVRNYLVSGDSATVTMQEVVMFMNLCKYQHLNPFLREAYLIKYGSQPATIVTGKSALEKRAMRNPSYKGFKAGIVVVTKDGRLDKRTGAILLPDEQLVGGWCEVFINGLEPVSVTVSMSEYAGRKKDGTLNQQWSAKPATMIRKVAKMQALREAFPEDLEGMYSSEEIGESELPTQPVIIEQNKELIEIPEKQPETDEFAMLMEGLEENE